MKSVDCNKRDHEAGQHEADAIAIEADASFFWLWGWGWSKDLWFLVHQKLSMTDENCSEVYRERVTELTKNKAISNWAVCIEIDRVFKNQEVWYSIQFLLSLWFAKNY